MDEFDEAHRESLARAVRTWARTHRRFGEAIRSADPSWGTDVFDLGSGVVALHGRGLYVNMACAVGIDEPLTDDDLDELERRSAAVGVDPAVEVTPLTRPDAIDALIARGYVADDEVVAFGRHPTRPTGSGTVPDWLVVESIGPDRVAEWQAAAAEGWGHTAAAARRASDAFSAAAAEVDEPGLLLAIDAGVGVAAGVGTETGTTVGCASLSVHDGVATLGGMSTLPAARRRGVQGALIEHRLALAAELGCDLAISTAVPDSASARNLSRHGFDEWCRIVTWIRPAD